MKFAIFCSLLVIGTACTGAAQQANSETLEVSEGTGPPVTEGDFHEAGVSEAEAFKRLLAEATEDGVLSGAELEVFALEAVACMGRAGLDAELIEFDPRTGDTGFGVGSSSGEEEDPVSQQAAEGCQNTFFVPAFDVFSATSGETGADGDAEQEQREAQLLNCLEEVGYQYDDVHVALTDDSVPESVREECLIAYFE